MDLALQRYQLHRPHNAPLFTAPAVWTVMLAIAGNHHLFSVVKAVMLRPWLLLVCLPFAQGLIVRGLRESP